MPVVQPDALTAFVAQTFVAAGAKQEHADLVATSLVNTNLTGHDSHGVVRVPQYLMLRNSRLDKPRTITGARYLLQWAV